MCRVVGKTNAVGDGERFQSELQHLRLKGKVTKIKTRLEGRRILDRHGAVVALPGVATFGAHYWHHSPTITTRQVDNVDTVHDLEAWNKMLVEINHLVLKSLVVQTVAIQRRVQPIQKDDKDAVKRAGPFVDLSNLVHFEAAVDLGNQRVVVSVATAMCPVLLPFVPKL